MGVWYGAGMVAPFLAQTFSCKRVLSRLFPCPLFARAQQVVTPRAKTPGLYDNVWSCNSSDTIHLCIDVLEGYAAYGGFGDWWGIMKFNIYSMVSALQRKGVKTAYVVYDPRLPPLKNGIDVLGSVPHDIRPFLAAPSNKVDFDLTKHDLLAIKNKFSAGQVPEIMQYLRANNYKTVILSGVFEAKNIWRTKRACVTATAKDLRRAGFNVVIAAETTQLGVPQSPYYFSLAARRFIHGLWRVPVLPVADIVTGVRMNFCVKQQTKEALAC